MDQDDLFQAYYAQYRVEADTPNSGDDEYIIFTNLANEAINRWANYDNTFWKELYTTAQLADDGDTILDSTTTEYAAPSNMRVAGGYVRVFDTNNVTQGRIPIIEPQEAQFMSDTGSYCYFIGDPNNGFTLVINPSPRSEWNGYSIDYVYYKKPTTFSEPTDVSEMSQPYFIVHRALANRFRGSRNPYYQSAKNDAEDTLRTMQMENNSGNWADPWKLSDRSDSQWGEGYGGPLTPFGS
jgi:hypothetical protein